MIWSKMRKIIESGFADELSGVIQIHLTTYANSAGWMGRGWITFRGEEIANFSTPETWRRFDSFSNRLCGQWPESRSHNPIDNQERDINNLVEKGEFSRYDFGGSCWEFINMNIKDAQTSTNPILRALAVLDKRTGKRNLLIIEKSETRPLVKRMIELRLSAKSMLPIQA
jgi:hypothetical protein